MAVVKLTDGKKLIMPHEKAVVIWQVLNGEIDGTEEQVNFCTKVERVFLSRYKAPASYLRHYAELIRRMDK